MNHYYPSAQIYDGNPQDINMQYKRDIQAAELDHLAHTHTHTHLVIMDLLCADLKNGMGDDSYIITNIRYGRRYGRR